MKTIRRDVTLMKETMKDGQTLETEVIVDQSPYNFLIDTGSAFTYIDEKIALKHNLPIKVTERTMAILVYGSHVESTKETMLEFKFKGDELTSYKIKARVLKDMSLSGIIGMDFLMRNYAKIDLAEGIITLDNKHYELNLEFTKNEFDSKF
ncbi:hypothetical protein DMUE_1408 [Dictyocoela muelleri]|nr:hypothetical protein DMUE_1408 [Dictyocoela muelleri]